MAYRQGRIESFVETKPDNYMQKAADIIRQRGHCQGAFKIGDRHCLVEAIAVAKYGEGIGEQYERLTPADLAPLTGIIPYFNDSPYSRNRSPLCAWNNQPSRTADEVIAALEAAAKKVN